MMQQKRLKSDIWEDFPAVQLMSYVDPGASGVSFWMATLASEEALKISREGGRQAKVQIGAPFLCSCTVLGNLFNFSDPHVSSGMGIRLP